MMSLSAKQVRNNALPAEEGLMRTTRTARDTSYASGCFAGLLCTLERENVFVCQLPSCGQRKEGKRLSEGAVLAELLIWRLAE